jgi:prepilin-type N-terminal cleavage/methylation domain-containing protein
MSERNAERNAERDAGVLRRRDGFTLVEVIVVLVILAILAAIAIPALTGYIDKAEDRQYITQARNVSVAMKTVLNEEYASGKIDRITTVDGEGRPVKEGFTQGTAYGENDNYVTFSLISVAQALYGVGEFHEYNKRATALMGETYPGYGASGTGGYAPCAKANSGATAATADGFIFTLYPEGLDEGNPEILVTYRFKRMAVLDSNADAFGEALDAGAVYDPNAGYEVYKLIM